MRSRSILEGVAFSLRDVLAAITAAGHSPTLLRMVGGAARSATWAQIVADALDVPIETVTADEPALTGAAILGAVGAGIHRDLPRAVGAMTGMRRRHEPCPRARSAYTRTYQRFQEAAAGARALARTPLPSEPRP